MAALVVASLAATGASATSQPGSLESLADAIDATALPAADYRRARLRSAEAGLQRADAPQDGCGEALGAARFAALHTELARARAALGERQGALSAWRAAAACAPRDPQPRREIATALMALGRLDEARAELGRAATLARGSAAGLDEARTRLDFAAGRWADAARGAAAIAARLEREGRRAQPQAAGDAPVPDGDEAAGALPASRAAAGFWRLLERLAQRRGALPAAPSPPLDPGADGAPWPAPLWRHLDSRLDERGLVAAIAADPDPRRRREMACEALYYTAQQALAEGREAEGRRRLARVVNLKIVEFIEHDLALAELARRRAP